MKKLVIIGDSAFAEVAFEYFKHDSDFTPIAFCVEDNFLRKTELFGLPIIGMKQLEETFPPEEYYVFIAITYTALNTLRERLFIELLQKGYTFASYVSSRAFIWHNVRVGRNCFIFEDNTIQPFVEIDDNCVIWSGNHIGHHSRIEKNCFISSHVCISGFCNVGMNSFIGVNSTISNNVAIGEFNWIGPSVIVAQNTDPDRVWNAPKMEPKKVSAKRAFKV
jgi:sugar O-acyltransferase (sialic acid O-acetyltransferase NeuD family)